MALPCKSFSILRSPFGSGTRSKSKLGGVGQRADEKEGNTLLAACVWIIKTRNEVGARWTQEYPWKSFAFKMHSIQRLFRRSDGRLVLVDQCMYGLCEVISGKLHRKRSGFLGNLARLENLGVHCSRDHEHEEVLGQIKVDGRWIHRSTLAGRYPDKLVQKLAEIVEDEVKLSRQYQKNRKSARLFWFKLGSNF